MLLMTLGCESASVSSPEPTETVGPLTAPFSVGTRWTYARVDSVEFGATPFQPSTFTVTATQDTVIGSLPGVVLENGRSLVENLLGPIAMRRASNGIFTATAASPFLPGTGGWRVLLPYPVAAGMSFNFGWVVTSTDTTITVPYGVVRCVRYDFHPEDPVGPARTLFLAPGLGIVLSVHGRLDELNQAGQVIGRHRSTYRLVSITPGGG